MLPPQYSTIACCLYVYRFQKYRTMIVDGLIGYGMTIIIITIMNTGWDSGIRVKRFWSGVWWWGEGTEEVREWLNHSICTRARMCIHIHIDCTIFIKELLLRILHCKIRGVKKKIRFEPTETIKRRNIIDYNGCREAGMEGTFCCENLQPSKKK